MCFLIQSQARLSSGTDTTLVPSVVPSFEPGKHPLYDGENPNALDPLPVQIINADKGAGVFTSLASIKKAGSIANLVQVRTELHLSLYRWVSLLFSPRLSSQRQICTYELTLLFCFGLRHRVLNSSASQPILSSPSPQTLQSATESAV